MTDEPSIPPALTAEEWRRVAEHPQEYVSAEAQEAAVGVGSFHAVAAMALYGQPFGFDFTDRDRLREIADEIDRRGLPDAWSDRLRDVAARIAALLPPT
jgi:hypothetical protein